MRSILLSLLLFSVLSAKPALAETLYICNTTKNIGVENHEMIEYRAERFKFILTGEEVVFGSGVFEDIVVPLHSRYEENWWTASDETSSIAFREGDLIYTASVAYEGESFGTVVTARCDRF